MALKRLSQTNEMISEDLYGTQAWRVNEISPYGEGHDRVSEARGMGCLLGFVTAFPYKEGCEGILSAFGQHALMQRNEASCDTHRGRKLN